VIAQVMGRFAGDIIFKLYFLFSVAFPFLVPLKREKRTRPISEVNVEMCYPYYQFWKEIICLR
jgi:hypothetical protein